MRALHSQVCIRPQIKGSLTTKTMLIEVNLVRVISVDCVIWLKFHTLILYQRTRDGWKLWINCPNSRVATKMIPLISGKAFTKNSDQSQSRVSFSQIRLIIIKASLTICMYFYADKNSKSLARQNILSAHDESIRSKQERQDHLQTMNRVNQKVPFKTGILINRVFESQVSGSGETTEQIRKSIDESSC